MQYIAKGEDLPNVNNTSLFLSTSFMKDLDTLLFFLNDFRYPPIIAEALEIANAPEVPCVIYQRPKNELMENEDQITKKPKRIIEWEEAVNDGNHI